MSPFYLVFCKRAVAAGAAISSLVFWQPAYAQDIKFDFGASSSQMREVRVKAQALESLLARAGNSYTIPNTGANIPEGIYSNIIVPNPGNASTSRHPDFYIRTGTVTLTGGEELLFDVSYGGHRQLNDTIFIQPNGAGPAELVLEQGQANGSINLVPAQYRGTYYAAKLLIGSGNPSESATDELPTVSLTGHIDGLAHSVVAGNFPDGRTVTVETQGANLVVNGAIGYHNGPSYITYLNAHQGNIEVKLDEQVYASDGRISAFMASAQNGYHIEAASETDVYGVDLGQGSYLKVTDDNNIVVVNTIGDPSVYGGGGKMEADSLLEAADFVQLWGGVQKAAGRIYARQRSILTHNPFATPFQETQEAPINQGGEEPLTLEAAQDVMAGGINVDTIISGRDIISGSVSANGTVPANGHIFLNAGGDGFHYPRTPITANTITALATDSASEQTNGRVIAGEITLPRPGDNKSTSLGALHLMTIRQDREGSLSASTGNFTMSNGEMHLTGSTPMSYQIGDGDTVGNDAPSIDLEYASYVGNDMTLTDVKGDFTTLGVENTSDVTGGTMSGALLHTGSAIFKDISETAITDALQVVNDLTVTGNGASNVKSTDVGGNSSITGGTWEGDIFKTGKSAQFQDVSNLDITEQATIGASLGLAQSAASFAALQTGNGVTVTDSEITANKLMTGASGEKDGDVTITNGSFTFPATNQADNIIHGSLTGTGLKTGDFGNLQVDGAVNLADGTISGAALTAAGAVFKDNKISISDKLDMVGDISFSGSAERNITQVLAGGAFAVNGGSYEGTSIQAGSAEFVNTTSMNVGGSTVIEGALSARSNGYLFFKQLQTGAGVKVEGGSFTAGEIITGTNGNGDVSLTNNKFTLGKDGAGSAIHGNLNAIGEGSGTFGVLTVDGSLAVSGGFVEGESLTAGRAILKNNAQVHINELNLDNADTALDIEEGSVLTVGSLNGVAGDAIIGANGAIVIEKEWKGGNQDAELGENSDIDASAARVEVGNITGAGKGAERDDIRAHQLKANNIDITDANLFLTGLGDEYRSSVAENLIIEENGSSRLGDMDVGLETKGIINISGGSVTARQLRTGGDATFNDGTLNLAGVGDLGSEIGGALILNNEISQLGDIKITGDFISAGGSVEADWLDAKSNVTMNDSELTLNGLKANPSVIAGDLTLEANRKASLSHINITGSITGNGGDVAAHVINVGGDVSLNGVNFSLHTLEDQKSAIGGNLTLDDNQVATLGAIEIAGMTSVTGGEVNADAIKSGSMRLGNANATFQTVNITGEAQVSGGKLNARSFTGDSVAFSNGLAAALEELMFDGTAKTFAIGAASDTIGFTSVQVSSLNLNGGALTVGNVTTEPVALAVRNFVESNGPINGNVAIGRNGRLILGSSDLDAVPQGLYADRAILALEQPMRLGAGYGMHITGTGTPAPIANQINFDAASLFQINGSDARTYYTGEFIKTAQLDADNGAIGALSAQNKVAANIDFGAEIYIRNPIPNTVIVALGENITTYYSDSSSKGRVVSSAPWTGANLRYDNQDKVTIERLEGEYAGQFSVKLKDSETPPTPPAPDNPNPPTPTPPAPDDPDTPTPPALTPDDPDTPTPPAPDDPDTPTPPDPEPDNPDNPDKPTEPEEPEPDPEPEQPVPPTPTNPVQPSRPAKPHQTHPNAHPAIHQAINHGTNTGVVGDQPHHFVTTHGGGFLSYTSNHDKPHEATHYVEGALRMPITGAVPQMILMANHAAESAMAARVALDNFILPKDVLHTHSFAVWAVPLYNTGTGWSLDAGSHDYEYNGGIGGIAIGGDYSVEKMLRLGLSFNIGGGYSKSGGDLTETTNNMNFWGLGAYGIWAYGNFGLSGNVAYTSSYNKLKQDISGLRDWNELKADLQAHAFSAGMELQYKLAADWLDIYPHIGGRYHYIEVEDYSIKHHGNDIIKGDSFSQNIWTFPIGLKFGKDFTLENGWNISPALDLRVVPAAGDLEARTTSRFTAIDHDITLHTQTMDYIAYGGSLGLEANLNNFTLGVNYSLEAGAKTVSNSVFGTLRFEF